MCLRAKHAEISVGHSQPCEHLTKARQLQLDWRASFSNLELLLALGYAISAHAETTIPSSLFTSAHYRLTLGAGRQISRVLKNEIVPSGSHGARGEGIQQKIESIVHLRTAAADRIWLGRLRLCHDILTPG
jgi:hypothetical protein